MKKQITALLLALLAVFAMTACKEEAVEEEKKTTEISHEKETEPEKEEGEEEVEVEVIYAKTPEEAAERCLKSLYAGKPDDAKHYVDPKGNAFSEFDQTKKDLMDSLGVSGNGALEDKAEKFISNVFSKFKYSRESVEENGKMATVKYTVSMPDMANINYSSYMDKYMAAKGISQESLMMELEGMSQEESENWSKEFGLDILNYVFEGNEEFARLNTTTTVYLKKGKNGWIVTDIKNLAG